MQSFKLSRLFFPLALIGSLMLSPAVLAKKPKTDEEKFSYIMGLEVGSRMQQQFQHQGIDADMELVTMGIMDATSGKEPSLSKEEIQETMKKMSEKMQEKQKEMAAQMEAQGKKNEEEGKKFLEQNGKKDGVVTTESGLQYKILEKGNGPKPTVDDTVTVNYRGTLLDGTEFDSSYKRGEPAVFPVNAVIPGWTEVLQLMPEGSKWEVYIPSDLAYGPGGAGGKIGPHATLVFEIELLKARASSGD
jgi:FKBP-type peptidyl-prolyl cis-trans isomerase